MLFDHPEFAPERLASLRSIGYGAMPMPGPLLDRLRRLLPGVELVQGFGMTEAGALTMLQPEDHARPELLGSVGRSVPGVNLSIQDPGGQLLGPGEIGEVCAQGGNLLDGYWNDAPATAEAFRAGWYRTGDVGRLDAEGYLFLADRLKDMIVTGGENVYSVEVESVIAGHPGVAQVAVIGRPDEKWGEVVHAIVVSRPGYSLQEADVIACAREGLAGFKVPKSVEVRTEPLPMSAAMKPLKRELRGEFSSDQFSRD
jgi:acyl-CoA synthetase (AMP-forming)/AMP-acid ligase II